MAIENMMVLVRERRLARLVLPPHDPRAEVGDLFRDQRFSEANYFHRNRKSPQDWCLLRRIGDDDQLLARGGYDLLAEHRAAAAFDQVQSRIEFVRPVDGHVDLLYFLKARQRDAKLCGEITRGNRCWNAANVQAGPHALANQPKRDGRGRSRPQPNDLAIPDVFQTRPRRYFLFCFIGHGYWNPNSV